jgi:membrane protein implicated in regulation of membrane protease activity
MLSAYIVCLVAGGIVLAVSIFGVHESHEADVEHFDTDGGHHGHEGLDKLPFLSLRFWIWAATFFGLTGLVLSLIHTSQATALVLAVVAGVGTGWGASHVIGKLTKDAVGVLPEAASHIGCEGKLLLPLRRGELSKVRLHVGGADVDLVAESDSAEPLPAGTTVWVVELRGTHVVVEASPVSLDRPTA